MDEKKLKIAFSKVKEDINNIGDDIAKLRMQLAQSLKVDKVDSNSGCNSEEFVKNLEVELSSVKGLISKMKNEIELNSKQTKEYLGEIKGYNEKFDVLKNEFGKNLEGELSLVKNSISKLSVDVSLNSKQMNGHSVEIKDCNKKIEDLKKNLNENLELDSKTINDVSIVNQKLADFQGLVNDKLTLEIAELKLEMSEEIAKAFDNMTKGLEKIEKKSKTEEVKKSNVLDSKQRTLIEEVEYQEEESKPSKFKKAIKWLFVDEDEEDEILSVKSEIEKKENKK